MAWTRDDLHADPHAHAQKAVRVQAMFGAIANTYDLNNRLHALWLDQRWRRRMVELLHVGPGDRVLDVACGTGDLSEIAAGMRPASVTGVDFTPEMLEIARAKAARRTFPGVTPQYDAGDATKLQFSDAAFDVVMIAFGIRNVDDTAAALSEFHRVLAPGGRLGILEFSEPSNALLRWGNAMYTRRIMPLTATLIARDRSGAYAYLPKSIETYLDPAALAQAASTAGFTLLEQRPLTFGTCTATVLHKPAAK